MHGLLVTIGVLPSDQAPIDYRERAPLVVPPKLELPPPQDKAAARGGRWPTDPNNRPETPENLAFEAQQRDLLMEGQDGTHIPVVKKKKSPNGEGLGAIFSEAANAANRSGGSRRVTGAEGDATHLSAADEIDPDKEKPKLASGAEPARKSLIQPPIGYRAPPKVDHPVDPTAGQSRNPWDIFGIFSKRD